MATFDDPKKGDISAVSDAGNESQPLPDTERQRAEAFLSEIQPRHDARHSFFTMMVRMKLPPALQKESDESLKQHIAALGEDIVSALRLAQEIQAHVDIRVTEEEIAGLATKERMERNEYQKYERALEALLTAIRSRANVPKPSRRTPPTKRAREEPKRPGNEYWAMDEGVQFTELIRSLGVTKAQFISVIEKVNRYFDELVPESNRPDTEALYKDRLLPKKAQSEIAKRLESDIQRIEDDFDTKPTLVDELNRALEKVLVIMSTRPALGGRAFRWSGEDGDAVLSSRIHDLRQKADGIVRVGGEPLIYDAVTGVQSLLRKTLRNRNLVLRSQGETELSRMHIPIGTTLVEGGNLKFAPRILLPQERKNVFRLCQKVIELVDTTYTSSAQVEESDLVEALRTDPLQVELISTELDQVQADLRMAMRVDSQIVAQLNDLEDRRETLIKRAKNPARLDADEARELGLIDTNRARTEDEHNRWNEYRDRLGNAVEALVRVKYERIAEILSIEMEGFARELRGSRRRGAERSALLTKLEEAVKENKKSSYVRSILERMSRKEKLSSSEMFPLYVFAVEEGFAQQASLLTYTSSDEVLLASRALFTDIDPIFDASARPQGLLGALQSLSASDFKSQDNASRQKIRDLMRRVRERAETIRSETFVDKNSAYLALKIYERSASGPEEEALQQYERQKYQKIAGASVTVLPPRAAVFEEDFLPPQDYEWRGTDDQSGEEEPGQSEPELKEKNDALRDEIAQLERAIEALKSTR